MYVVKAKVKSEVVGELHFIKSKFKASLMAGSLTVKPSHRRIGIASGMYEFAEEETGMTFTRSDGVLTADGKKLWDNPNRKFGNKK